MNSINIKTENSNTIFKYQNYHKLTILFRSIEILIFLIIISRFSTQLPFAISISFDQVKGVSFAVFSSRFVFLIGNLIILILLFKSRVIENGDYDGTIGVYDEYVKRCEKNVVVNNMKICRRSRSEKLVRVDVNDRKLRRSVTEKIAVKEVDCGGVTVAPERMVVKEVDCGGVTVAPEKKCVEDELSCDEFRRTVEAFIARQQQLLRDEKLAPVAYVSV